MKILLLENSEEIRRSFTDHFIMSWAEFQVELKVFIDEMTKKNIVVDMDLYNHSYLWDKISSKYPRVSFREACNYLSNIDSNIIFMSEDENVPSPAKLCWQGVVS